MLELLGDDEMLLIEDAEMASQVSDAELSSVQALGDRHLKLTKMVEKIEEVVKKIKEAVDKVAFK